jgi:hypothetical protein
MPLIVNQPLGPPTQLSTRGGWTCSQLIELADRRTERRGSKLLDLQSEFLMALQEFCMEKRWPWRRRTTQLTTTAGSWEYDLTDPTNANVPDLHQFMQHGVKTYPNPGAPTSSLEITPLFERGLQDAAIFSARNYPLQFSGPPSQYFMMPGAFLVMALTPVPDQVYPISIGYWSVPNINEDSLPEAIPLLPAFLHHALLKKLEAQIFRFTLGEGTPKYQAAMSEYTALVNKYELSMGMTPGEQIDWSHDDNEWSTDHSAIQSTR